MTSRIFYEKVGRRYRPVYEWDQGLMDAMPRGTHLVMCYPGGQSTRYNVDPNLAALIAAGRVAEDAMCNAVRKASEMRPTHTPITKEQRQAWRVLSQSFGDDLATLQTASAHDIVQAGLDALEKEAASLMEHPAVRDAYEQFLLVCKLTKESSDSSSS